MKIAAIAAVAILIARSPLRSAEVEVRPYAVLDARQKQLEEAQGDVVRSEVGLTVTILLKGKPVEAATHWGHLKVLAAEDDKGNRLLPEVGEHGAIPSSDFAPIDRSMMFYFDEKKPKDQLLLDLRLRNPARSVSSLARLEGSLKLAAGRMKDVISPSVADLIGKPFEEATLKSAGIGLRITKASPTPPIVLELEAKDPRKALAEVDIIDASGKKVSSGQAFMEVDGKKTIQLMADEALPPGARLKLSVLVERKETEVPFKISKIELP